MHSEQTRLICATCRLLHNDCYLLPAPTCELILVTDMLVTKSNSAFSDQLACGVVKMLNVCVCVCVCVYLVASRVFLPTGQNWRQKRPREETTTMTTMTTDTIWHRFARFLPRASSTTTTMTDRILSECPPVFTFGNPRNSGEILRQ